MQRFNLEKVFDGDVTYTPFVKDGRVGYIVDRPSIRTYIYFNPSHRDGDEGDSPNVFVYTGANNDPSYDTPQVFVNV
jgi:hypothetical protein